MNFKKFNTILHEHARMPIEIDRSLFEETLADFEVIEKKPRFMISRRLITTLMSVIMFLAIFTTFTILEFTPTKTLTIDLNPGFEVVMNRFNRVVSVNAVGDEAAGMIDEIRYWHQTPEKVLNNIVAISIQKGYATTGDVTLLISVDTTDEVLLEKLSLNSESMNLKTMFMSINMTETVRYTSQLTLNSSSNSVFDSFKIYTPVIQESDSIDSAQGSPESFYDSVYGDVALSSEVQWTEDLLVSLANYHQITLGKLQLVIAVFEAYEEYDSETEFLSLIEAPISTLIDLYENRS